MTAPAEPRGAVTCARCGTSIDDCSFCEEVGCREPLCYRCVRIALAQEVRQPHGHGG